MKNLRRRFIFGFLFLIVIGVFAPLCYQPDLAALDLVGVKAGDFAPGQLEEHYLKHGYQFGKITQEQYLQDAQALLDAAARRRCFRKNQA